MKLPIRGTWMCFGHSSGTWVHGASGFRVLQFLLCPLFFFLSFCFPLFPHRWQRGNHHLRRRNKHFLIFTNDFTGHEDYTTNGHLTVESKEKVISDHMTIYISHERVEVTNYRGYQAVYDSTYLFQLSGQLIGTPPSTATDIWLSMNRVIRNSYRRGTGLCKVAISWV